jgi:hypothetical protein
MKKVTAAAVQATPVLLDREATVDKSCVLIKEAGTNGAGLVVFPETFIPTYPDWVWRAPVWDGPPDPLAGGGPAGQAGAVRHGISRALLLADANLRPTLKADGLLTRDPRMKERKKYGQPGARKRFQFSKR